MVPSCSNFSRQKEIVDLILLNQKRDYSRFDLSLAAEAFAPSNIALIKYWGKRDEVLNLPLTNSLSISLPGKGAWTQVSLREKEDQILLNGEVVDPKMAFARRMQDFLDLFRFNTDLAYRIETKINIPVAAGLASSACGFAALVLALDRFYGWTLSNRALSILARLGSGSACRSIESGWMEWHSGGREDGMDSFAQPLNIDWSEFRMGLILVSEEKKSISSRAAMKQTVMSSPRYSKWPKRVDLDLKTLKQALSAKDFQSLGEVVERNADEMHALMREAVPSIDFSLPQTRVYQERIRQLRKAGLSIYYTQDAGPNLKVLYLARDEKTLLDCIPKLEPIFHEHKDHVLKST